MVLEAFVDPKSSMEVVGVAAIALGQIYVSTGNGEVTDAMITLLSEKSEKELATPHAKVRIQSSQIALFFFSNKF